jgi:hypothetical protein
MQATEIVIKLDGNYFIPEVFYVLFVARSSATSELSLWKSPWRSPCTLGRFGAHPVDEETSGCGQRIRHPAFQSWSADRPSRSLRADAHRGAVGGTSHAAPDVRRGGRSIQPSSAAKGTQAEVSLAGGRATDRYAPLERGRMAATMIAHDAAAFGESPLGSRPCRLARVTVPVQVAFTGPGERRDEDIAPAATHACRGGSVFVSREVVPSSNHRTTLRVRTILLVASVLRSMVAQARDG